MSHKHTPEKWIAQGFYVYIEDEVIAVFTSLTNSIEENFANAARAVACVNALEGLNPKAVRELVEAVEWTIYGDSGGDLDKLMAAFAKVRQK